MGKRKEAARLLENQKKATRAAYYRLSVCEKSLHSYARKNFMLVQKLEEAQARGENLNYIKSLVADYAVLKKSQCPVCMEDFLKARKGDDEFNFLHPMVFDCGHLICRGCLKYFLGQNVDFHCPLCRKEIKIHTVKFHVNPVYVDETTNVPLSDV